ncbi:MAG TPA: LPS export ABC transporter periplasmic protein LptC [Gemmatimonadaceae bacterium]|jgi:LPS export ABC transporter protein LptC|nr:LPS export ABC transporter periplasmic protein LptC [Gemmatimonadaceae bacterium]
MRRALVIATTLLVAAAACQEKGTAPPVQHGRTMADSAEQVLLNVRMLLTDHGVQRGEMFADTGYVFDDNTRFEFRKVRATFNTTTGTKDGVMSGDRGRYSTREQILEGFGNVVIITTEGKRLTSPHIRYSQGLNEVSSDTNFTLVEPGRNLSGIGFKADPQLTRIQVLRAGQGRGSLTLPAQ